MNRRVSLIHNQRGDILLVALIMVGICLIAGMVMLAYSRQVMTISKLPRIKSMMMALEAKARTELLKPTSYTGCTSAFGTGGGRATCTLNAAAITSLSRRIPEAPCPPSKPGCGLDVKLVNFNPALLSGGQVFTRATLSIKYEGTDYNLRPIDFTVDVPADILQGNGIYECPPLFPKFLGFNPDGTLNCDKLPDRAGPNEFLSSIDYLRMTTTTKPLPPAANCAPGEYVDHVDWGSGGTAFNFTCAPRPDPFTSFGFSPKLAPAGNITVTPNPDYP